MYCCLYCFRLLIKVRLERNFDDSSGVKTKKQKQMLNASH